MASLRFALLATLILAGLVHGAVALAQAPVEWYSDTGGGGTIALPRDQPPSGGTVVPLGHRATPGAGDIDNSAEFQTSTPPLPTPSASAAEADPDLAASTPHVARPQAIPSQEAPSVTGGDSQENSDAGLIGALPLTGLQLALVAGAGLFLLLAGFALRPRRSRAAA
jgi:hypothetical protein